MIYGPCTRFKLEIGEVEATRENWSLHLMTLMGQNEFLSYQTLPILHCIQPSLQFPSMQSVSSFSTSHKTEDIR